MKAMSKQYLFLIIPCLFVGLLFSSCANNSDAGEKDSPTVSLLTTSSLNGFTPSKTTIIPPTPSATKTPALASIPTSYDLPKWMSDENNVLMIVTDVTETTNQLSFINANTNEQYLLSIPSAEIRGYFWTPDGKYFGFLSDDNQSVYLVDTANGLVNKVSINEQATILLNQNRVDHYTLERLGVFGSFSNENVLFYYCRLCYSFDFTYTTDWEYPNGENTNPQISTKNIFTGDKTLLTKPDNSIENFETVWSPIKPEIAILQGSKPISPDFGFPPWSGNRITIYNAKTSQIVDTYLGNFVSIQWNWSPDGRKILYRNLTASQDYAGTKLCVLDLAIKRSVCIDKVQNTKTSSFSDFEWSNDGKSVYYINYTLDPHRSDLCVYNLQNASINCPTKNITELSSLNVEGFIASNDGNYFLVSYGNSCSTCDYWGEPSIAIVRNDGISNLLIGKQVSINFGNGPIFYPAFYNALWRPILKP